MSICHCISYWRLWTYFAVEKRKNVLAQLAGPATKMFRILLPAFIIKSWRALANTIGCTRLFVSTCNAHPSHWQWFQSLHSSSVLTHMTSIQRVLMHSIVTLDSCIFQVVHTKSYLDFGARLTKEFARSFLLASFSSQAFVNYSVSHDIILNKELRHFG